MGGLGNTFDNNLVVTHGTNGQGGAWNPLLWVETYSSNGYVYPFYQSAVFTNSRYCQAAGYGDVIYQFDQIPALWNSWANYIGYVQSVDPSYEAGSQFYTNCVLNAQGDTVPPPS